MPFDGNGNYKFPINSWNPAVNGNQATAQDWQQTINDLATALSSVVVADGQKMLSGNLRMGNNKVTGLGAPSDDTDAVRRAQLKKGTSITSAATITAPTEGSSFDVNGSVNLEGFSGGYDGQSFVLVFSNVITIKNSERLKTSSGLDIKVVVGHAYNFVRLADDRWFVFDTTRTAESISFKPEGAIAATNVQAAIKELDDEKQPKGNYQPAGDYQPALGYAPVNKAGDTDLGSMRMVAGGDIHSSSWGGWLSAAINSKISTADLPAVLANLPTGGVGTLGLMMADSPAGQTGPGATASGAHLRWSSAAGQDWGTPAGTWRCLGGSSGVFNQSSSVTLWQRVA